MNVNEHLSEPVVIGGVLMNRGQALESLARISRNDGYTPEQARQAAERYMQGYDLRIARINA